MLLMKWSSEVVWVTLSCKKFSDINLVSQESYFQKTQDFSMTLLRRLKAKESKCTSPVIVLLPDKWKLILNQKDVNSLKDLMLILNHSISDQIQESDLQKLSREPTLFSGTVQLVFLKFLNSEMEVKLLWEASSTEPKKESLQLSVEEIQSVWSTLSMRRRASVSFPPEEEPV